MNCPCGLGQKVSLADSDCAEIRFTYNWFFGYPFYRYTHGLYWLFFVFAAAGISRTGKVLLDAKNSIFVLKI